MKKLFSENQRLAQQVKDLQAEIKYLLRENASVQGQRDRFYDALYMIKKDIADTFF